MKSFKDFRITPMPKKNFEGKKLKIANVLNVQIAVLDYKIEASNYGEPGTKRLTLQIEIKGEKRIFWTSSKALLHDIQLIPATGFPFTTTIIEQEDESYQFT